VALAAKVAPFRGPLPPSYAWYCRLFWRFASGFSSACQGWVIWEGEKEASSLTTQWYPRFWSSASIWLLWFAFQCSHTVTHLTWHQGLRVLFKRFSGNKGIGDLGNQHFCIALSPNLIIPRSRTSSIMCVLIRCNRDHIQTSLLPTVESEFN
jgi:hypothetical protein